MRFYKQRVMHDPDNGKTGDCFRTCIACMLDVDPSRVPNFMHLEYKGDTMVAVWRKVNKWLATRHGVQMVEIPFVIDPDTDFELQVLGIGRRFKDMKYLFSGLSPRGYQHCTIYQEGRLLHDPSPLSGGIVGPDEDSLVWAGFFISHSIHENWKR